MEQEYTRNVSNWTNKKLWICLHHTAGGTLSWATSRFKNPKSQASAHYIVWPKGDVVKFNDDNAILRHAWLSKRQTKDGDWYRWLNACLIWIEIVDKNWTFTDIQRKVVDELVAELMEKHGIWNDWVIRHKDIAWYRWKIDPYDTLRNNRYKTFEDYQNSFDPDYNKLTPEEEEEKRKDIVEQMNINSDMYNKVNDKQLKKFMSLMNDRYRELWFDN